MTRGGATAQPNYSCIDASSQCTCTGTFCTHTTITCAGPTDCPSGQRCCGTVAGTSYSELKCQTSCTTGQYEICDPNDGVDCANGSCHQSGYLPGYHVCY